MKKAVQGVLKLGSGTRVGIGKEELTHLYVGLLARNRWSLNCVERRGLREFVQAVLPGAPDVSRPTVRKAVSAWPVLYRTLGLATCNRSTSDLLTLPGLGLLHVVV